MYQRILVPLDGSAISDRALQEALKLARQQGAQVRLAHAVENVRFLDSEGFIDYAALQEVAQRSGEKILARAKAAAQQAGIAAETTLLESGGERIENVIVAEAKRWPADLIVIGTHGRSGFSRLLFGSVAEGVVRGAPTPLLLIRGE